MNQESTFLESHRTFSPGLQTARSGLFHHRSESFFLGLCGHRMCGTSWNMSPMCTILKKTTTLAWTFSPLTTHHTYSRAADLGGARNDSSTLSMLLDTQLAGRPNGRPARCGPKQNSPEGCERMSPLNFGATYIYMWHTATEKLFGAIHGHRWFSVVLVVFCLVPVVSYTSDILRPLVWIWMPARSCTAP